MCYSIIFSLLIFQFGVLYCIGKVDDFQPRETISLDGLWKFKISPENDQNIGFTEKWFQSDFKDYIDMPVPCSYNDVTANKIIRDFIGWAWYQYSFRLPTSMLNAKSLMLRFTSVHYFSFVWVDGEYVGDHEGGHIPFELNWPPSVSRNKELLPDSVYPTFTITVAVNNTLSNWTIPQGKLIHENDTSKYPPGYTSYSHDFDYFDYAGINGHVLIYSYRELINKVEIQTYYNVNGSGYIYYNVTREFKNSICKITLKDQKDNIVARVNGCSNAIIIPNAIPWWPVHSGKLPVGYLYSLMVVLIKIEDQTILDVYEANVGIRKITWNKTSLFINDVPVYLKGFGMHQDAEIRGRGFDLVQLTRDMNLLQWIGANAIRTSHYPYPKEFIEFTDRNGIMVIFESPACSLSNFDAEMLARHKIMMSEIYNEFGNHPSIIMWSMANEPLSNLNQSDLYFRTLKKHIKSLDKSRPITFVTSQNIKNEKAVHNVDIICLNRYSGWYSDGGRLELIEYQTVSELQQWFNKYHKPVIMTEFGAGSLAGLHKLPSSMWSENYQVDLFHEHFKAFDVCKQRGFLIGEMVWNFADFNTPQEYIRPGACVKGVFTRNREPKPAAFTLKERFTSFNKNHDKELLRCTWPPEVINVIINGN